MVLFEDKLDQSINSSTTSHQPIKLLNYFGYETKFPSIYHWLSVGVTLYEISMHKNKIGC